MYISNFSLCVRNFFWLWSLHPQPSDLKHRQNIILWAQRFSKKINVFEALKNDRNKYHTWISGKSWVPLVARSEDNEEKIVTRWLLIQDYGSELYGKIVDNHSIKDLNLNQTKVVKTSYSALQLFNFTWFSLLVFLITQKRKSQVSVAVDHTRSRCHQKKIWVEQICGENKLLQ